MSDSVWVAVTAVAAVAALVISFLAYRQKQSDTASKRTEERIRQIVKDEMAAIVLEHTALNAKLDSVITTQQTIWRQQEENGRRIGAVLDRVTVLETKIEVFWKSVAMDAAKIIHSPDPSRRHIDDLLESFMNGTMTPEQEGELRDILAVIRDYEPGVSHLTFPVYPGEQIAAAILLRTMSHALKQKGGG